MKKEVVIGILFILVLAGCQTQIVCNKPYILVGTSCCLDTNDNLICDDDEKSLMSSDSNKITADVVSREQLLDEKLAEINKEISESNPVIQNTTNVTTSQTSSESSTSSSSNAPQPETSVPETPQEQTPSGDSACVALGCPEGTNYVGSINSDKYHTCSCRYALQIHVGNVNCFKDKAEAESKGYVACGSCGA